jgi:hypothetical protein
MSPLPAASIRAVAAMGGLEDDKTRKSNQMRKTMRMSVIVLLCFLVGMEAQETSAAIRLKHFPPCPEGVVEKKICECRAYVSNRYDVCLAGQHCLRNAFHGMCL